MKKGEWTHEQQRAIHEKGNVIVSAAAGSGKTAVLTERVIEALKDENDPIPANRLLVVTFTNAAAAEMRGRIEQRLAEECLKDPDNSNLLLQKYLIPSAKICTIDSFCIDLIRENFELANVSPSFKIEDETAILPIYNAVFEQLLNEYLETGDPIFRDLLNIVGAEFDFSPLKERVLELFRFSRQMPFPEHFLDHLTDLYEKPFNADHPWFQCLIENALKRVDDLQQMLICALDQIESVEGAKHYNAPLVRIADRYYPLKDALLNNAWDDVYNLLQNKPDFTLKSFKGSAQIQYTVFKESVRAAKELWEDLAAIFDLDAATVNSQLTRMQPPVVCLVRFVREFATRAFEIQQQEEIFTFYNTEQMALSMLCRPTQNGFELSEAAESFFSRYDEVLVDEYQDVNDLQNLLFRILSNREAHLFTVGDIKQSIYSFRGSNPNLFLSRKQRAEDLQTPDSDRPIRINLSKNFRSRKGVCNFVNEVFRYVMTKETGTLHYNQSEELIAGADFPENEAPTAEILIMDNIRHNETDETDIVVEGKRIADYIHSVMSEPPFLRGENGLRETHYSDFTILLRSTKNKDSALAAELRRNGIPVTYSRETFLETTEVSTFLSLLRVIDNPDNDISLLTVMLSPIFGFTAGELAEYRSHFKKGSLISTVTNAAENGDTHANRFLDQLAFFRRESVMLSLPKFMMRLLLTTDYLNLVSAMNDGNRRRGNLQLLVGHASKYAERATGGIGGFLQELESMPESALSSAKVGGGEDVVHIMSMHKSKGLQFPICILAHLSDGMHSKDTHDNMLYNENAGIGFRYFEESCAQKVKTVAYKALAEQKRQERAEEELRILYVAMTRAEERLALVLPYQNLEKRIATVLCDPSHETDTLGHRLFYKAGSMRDWILPVLLRHPSAKPLCEHFELPDKTLPSETDLRIFYSDATDYDMSASVTAENSTESKPFFYQQELQERLSYRYPFEKLRTIEAKSTVSLLANHAERERFSFTAKPSFLLKNGISAARLGTATHHVMQFMRLTEKPDVDAEIERLVEWGYIEESDAAAVNRTALRRFFESSLYARILRADEVRREMRFLTEVPAVRMDSTLPPELAKEGVMVQGAVDLCIIENGQPTVIDFKTDRVETPDELISAYAEQLNIYSTACEKIFGCPIHEKLIYSFALEKTIVLP